MTDERRNERSDEPERDTERPKLTTAALAGAGTYFTAHRERQRETYEADPPYETEAAAVRVRDGRREDSNAMNAPAPRAEGPAAAQQLSRSRAAIPSYPTGTQAATAATMAREKPAIAREETTEAGPLFPAGEAADFRARWDDIQVRFIDEPRRCVEQADSLVAETMQRLAQSFAKERQGLEDQWDRGGDISTEDLRLALRRYRSFFGRLMQM